MAKIEMDAVISAATLTLEGEVRTLFIAKVNEMAKAEEEDRLANKAPKQPKGEYVVVLKSPGAIPDNTVASVFVIPNGDDPNTLLNSIRSATVTSNINQKKKTNVLKTFSEILFNLKPKWMKPSFKRMTKEWVQVITLAPGEDEDFISLKVVEKKEDFS